MAEESSSVERLGYVTPKWEERILTAEQVQCLAHIRKWVQTEAEFYGRTDDEFLYIFLFGCKFSVESIKKKMCKYYENRQKFPQWWANRDLKDPELLSMLARKTSLMLKDWGPNHPVVFIVKLSRFGEAMDTKTLDVYVRRTSLDVEFILRRRGAQMKGLDWILDASQIPLWLIPKLLSPKLIRDLVTSFLLSIPLRVKSANVINCTLIGYTIWSLVRPFLSRKLRNRVHIYRSDWTELYDHVDREYMPEEYGGNAGPLAVHEEEYLNEFLSYTEYISEDNQYGYQTTD